MAGSAMEIVLNKFSPGLVRIVNSLLLLLTTGIVFFLSGLFYIGSMEQHDALRDALPISFIFRFGLSSIPGLAMVGVIILLNQLLNKTILKGNRIINLKLLAAWGAGLVLASCLAGTSWFFFM